MLKKQPMLLDRRSFLKATSLLGGGLLLSLNTPVFAADSNTTKDFSPSAYIRLMPDNSVIISIGQSEMGQGALTGMAQIIAEELDLNWADVTVDRPAAAAAFNNVRVPAQFTGGSSSIRGFYTYLRQTGAAARQVLLAAAAQHWGQDIGSLKTQAGQVINSQKERINYGELSAIAAKLTPPALDKVRLKKASEFTIIGKALKRVDAPDKTTGKAVFGLDISLPGMLSAVVLHPPVFGAKVKTWNADEAKAHPGVVDVYEISGGIAVVANSYWRALKAREKLQVTWSEGTLSITDDSQHKAALSQALQQEGLTALDRGNIQGLSADDEATVASEYFVPFLSQASMEPLNCTVHVKSDSAEVWTGTQAQTGVQWAVAKLTGLSPETVKVNTTFLGGGFGRRSVQDFVILATEVAMRHPVPVKVIFTREDDMKAGYYRPAAACQLLASLDSTGKPDSLSVKLAVPDLVEHTGLKFLRTPEGVDGTAVEGFGAHFPYAIANVKTQWIKYDSGVPVWFWRAVGASQNAYFLETFIDQLASKAKRDPLQMRLDLLQEQPRFIAVLKQVAEKSDWYTPMPKGRARGIAVFESFGSVCAQVAEVSLANGKPVVEKVICVADVGQAINPDLVKTQMYGSIIYALSALNNGQITFQNSQVQQNNFWDHPVVRISEVPEMEVTLIDSNAHPGGVGEPATPPLAPAVCNALYALTGQKVLELPLAGQTFRLS